MKRPKACRSVSRPWRVLSFVLVVALTEGVRTAHAHPGHGRDADGTGAEHYLTEPVHALPIGAVLALASVVLLLFVVFLRAKKMRPNRIA